MKIGSIQSRLIQQDGQCHPGIEAFGFGLEGDLYQFIAFFGYQTAQTLTFRPYNQRQRAAVVHFLGRLTPVAAGPIDP